jgi:hypothetical protein
MKLIFLYGPPASGKLTVGMGLAALTNYKLFHNHASIDLVSSIFPKGSRAFHKLVEKIRIDFITEAAREKLDGLIFTFCYAHPQDKRFVDHITRIVEESGGEVCFVHLCCDKGVLKDRIDSSSRKMFGKITSAEKLEQVLEECDFFTPIPGRPKLIIDTSNLTPEEASREIVSRYGLQTM